MDNNNKTDDEIQDIPWQVSWKQPQWNSYTSHNQQDENNIESSSSSSSFVVGSVSAQIDPTELPSSYFEQSTQDDAESSSSPSSSSVILLTATLVQRKSKHRHRHRRHKQHQQQHNVASQLILELHRLPATKPQNNNDQHHRRVLLESRTFQWPEAVFMSNNSSSSDDDDDDDDIQEEEEEKEPKDEQDDLMTCNIPQGNAIRSMLQTFFPRRKQLQIDPDGSNPKKKKKKTKKRKPKKSPPQNGLVSAVFVRRNPSTTAQNNASSTDAMDTIALLSLGMMDYHSPSRTTTTFQQQQQQEEEKLEPTPHPQQDDAASTTSSTGPTNKKNLPELYLACMTVQGLIAIYSPWTLLNIHSSTTTTSGSTEKSQSPADNSSSNVGNTPEQEFVDGLATLFLGHEVFSTLEQAYKPLSQPISTISLSLLEQNQVYQHNSNAASTTATSSISSRNNTTRRGRRRPRALDVSLWNHLLESATLPHRTVANRVTQLAVAGTGHLIVLGTGIPYSQVFEDDDSSIFSKEEEKAVGRGNYSKQRKKQHQQEWDANSIATDHEDDHVDENTTISEDQVAGGGDTSHAHSQDDTHKWYSQDYQQEEVENEAKSEDDRKPPAVDNDEEDDDDDDDDSPVHLSTGGFVTFCSISQWSETRTLFTPFAPKHVSYIPQWNSMELLLVLGETQAMAIRMDSSNHPVVIGTSATSTPPNADTMLNTAIRSESTTEDMEGSSPPTTNNATNNSNNTMWIKRFQVLPIPFPQTSIKGRILCGSAMGVQPPALLQLFTEDEDALVLQKTLKGITSLGTIEMSHAPGHVAKMRAQEKESLDKTWSLLGQGWSILGTNQRVYFICWEGATAARGVAYVTELDASPNFGPKGAKVDFVLPLFPSTPVLTRKNLKLPFSDPVETSKLAEVAAAGSESKDEQADGDGFVMGALESISAMNYGGEDGLVSPSPRSSTAALTHREKSIRLLGQCSPWTQLEDDSDTMNQQVPVLSARFEKLTNPYYTLTMRQMVVENGPASPFQQVLSWLVEKEDYFTAAGIALDLLKDGETLFHLWKHADKIDEVDEQSKLDGLLDGIIPIGEEDYSDESKAATDAVESLADMTVACLTKGGFPMSTTLQRFLRHNKHYDASRACLMLAAIAANALSEGPESVSVTRENASIDDLLWPVRCLLEVGVTRDCLPTALLLLNSTIPDELRRRPIQYSESVGVPDMELTEKLVTSIVACDKGATDLLLDLVDDATRGSYWQSLDHSTSLVLSLIMVETKYPLLRHIEVRSWAQEQLHTCLKNKKMTVANEEDNLPTDWLKRLCVACLQNAGYDLERFEIPIAEPFVAVEEIPNAEPAEPFVAAEDGLKKYMAEISGVRSAFVSSPGPGGIDFDLLIPCLLLLESREVHWNNGNYAATQSILDATCFLAGHPTKVEPAFMFDGASAMRQCALAGNIRAGASLVGGKNGFVLHCCDVLISALGMKMDDAEAFFLDNSVSMGVLESVSSSAPFEVGDEHRHLLWLLDEHVLSVKTFGEFDTRHIRGKVDPVFCARSILRAWLFLTYGDKRNGVDWLVAYLKDRLDMNDTTRPSPHRLPCAALSRALFWTTAGGTTTLLCAQLDMDLAFLVQLALSCCGLVESVPRAVAEEIRRQPEAPSTAVLTGSLIPS